MLEIKIIRLACSIYKKDDLDYIKNFLEDISGKISNFEEPDLSKVNLENLGNFLSEAIFYFVNLFLLTKDEKERSKYNLKVSESIQKSIDTSCNPIMKDQLKLLTVWWSCSSQIPDDIPDTWIHYYTCVHNLETLINMLANILASLKEESMLSARTVQSDSINFTSYDSADQTTYILEINNTLMRLEVRGEVESKEIKSAEELFNLIAKVTEKMKAGSINFIQTSQNFEFIMMMGLFIIFLDEEIFLKKIIDLVEILLAIVNRIEWKRARKIMKQILRLLEALAREGLKNIPILAKIAIFQALLSQLTKFAYFHLLAQVVRIEDDLENIGNFQILCCTEDMDIVRQITVPLVKETSSKLEEINHGYKAVLKEEDRAGNCLREDLVQALMHCVENEKFLFLLLAWVLVGLFGLASELVTVEIMIKELERIAKQILQVEAILEHTLLRVINEFLLIVWKELQKLQEGISQQKYIDYVKFYKALRCKLNNCFLIQTVKEIGELENEPVENRAFYLKWNNANETRKLIFYYKCEHSDEFAPIYVNHTGAYIEFLQEHKKQSGEDLVLAQAEAFIYKNSSEEIGEPQDFLVLLFIISLLFFNVRLQYRLNARKLLEKLGNKIQKELPSSVERYDQLNEKLKDIITIGLIDMGALEDLTIEYGLDSSFSKDTEAAEHYTSSVVRDTLFRGGNENLDIENFSGDDDGDDQFECDIDKEIFSGDVSGSIFGLVGGKETGTLLSSEDTMNFKRKAFRHAIKKTKMEKQKCDAQIRLIRTCKETIRISSELQLQYHVVSYFNVTLENIHHHRWKAIAEMSNPYKKRLTRIFVNGETGVLHLKIERDGCSDGYHLDDLELILLTLVNALQEMERGTTLTANFKKFVIFFIFLFCVFTVDVHLPGIQHKDFKIECANYIKERLMILFKKQEFSRYFDMRELTKVTREYIRYIEHHHNAKAVIEVMMELDDFFIKQTDCRIKESCYFSFKIRYSPICVILIKDDTEKLPHPYDTLAEEIKNLPQKLKEHPLKEVQEIIEFLDVIILLIIFAERRPVKNDLRDIFLLVLEFGGLTKLAASSVWNNSENIVNSQMSIYARLDALDVIVEESMNRAHFKIYPYVIITDAIWYMTYNSLTKEVNLFTDLNCLIPLSNGDMFDAIESKLDDLRDTDFFIGDLVILMRIMLVWLIKATQKEEMEFTENIIENISTILKVLLESSQSSPKTQKEIRDVQAMVEKGIDKLKGDAYCDLCTLLKYINCKALNDENPIDNLDLPNARNIYDRSSYVFEKEKGEFTIIVLCIGGDESYAVTATHNDKLLFLTTGCSSTTQILVNKQTKDQVKSRVDIVKHLLQSEGHSSKVMLLILIWALLLRIIYFEEGHVHPTAENLKDFLKLVEEQEYMKEHKEDFRKFKQVLPSFWTAKTDRHLGKVLNDCLDELCPNHQDLNLFNIQIKMEKKRSYGKWCELALEANKVNYLMKCKRSHHKPECEALADNIKVEWMPSCTKLFGKLCSAGLSHKPKNISNEFVEGVLLLLIWLVYAIRNQPSKQFKKHLIGNCCTHAKILLDNLLGPHLPIKKCKKLKSVVDRLRTNRSLSGWFTYFSMVQAIMKAKT